MPARLVSGAAGLAQAAETLAAGKLVAVPTETVYGLAARALDSRACASIFEAKSRPLTDPLIVHLPPTQWPAWLERLATPGPLLLRAARAFWPGPLTIVAPARGEIPEIVRAGQPTVAIRVSAHPVLTRLLDRLGEPVAAPSANRFGRVSPTTAAHVLEELGEKIPLILDAGPCQQGIESTIVCEAGGCLRILRKGPVTADELAGLAPLSTASISTPPAPGSMPSHYAPATPLILESRPRPRAGRCGLLAWAGAPAEGFAACERLTQDGDPRQAAANLYAALRRLDRAGLDLIVAEIPPPGGLADAIAERLAKAAAPRPTRSIPGGLAQPAPGD